MIKSIFRATKKSINSYFLVPSLKALKVLPNNGELFLVDVGAAGEVEPRWKPFIDSLNYIGFEPDERSRETIRNQKNRFKNYQILPYALSNETSSKKFNLCKKPQVSSIYDPNHNFLNRFPDASRFDIAEITSFECVTLDSIDMLRIDFLKIDIQGAENDVLKGAPLSLRSILGLELEVEFIELYKDQPLFGEVCKTLSEYEIEFIDFVHLTRWERKGHNDHGQCIFGDALFLRSPESLIGQGLDVTKWSSYLAILIIYRRFDLVEIVLELMPEHMKSEFDNFSVSFEKVKKQQRLVNRIHFFLKTCFSFLGHGYKLHLIR